MVSLTGTDSLPAQSTLLTRTVLGPGTSAKDADQFVVPVAGWKGPLPSWTSTCATPLLSFAVPCTVTVPLVNLAPASGEVNKTAGFITSMKLAVNTRLDCMANVSTCLFVAIPPVQFVKTKPYPGSAERV